MKKTERFFAEWFVEKIGWDSCEIFDDEEPDFKINDFGLRIIDIFKIALLYYLENVIDSIIGTTLQKNHI
ncbi:MAG: hypothetical protein K8S16_13370 [Bacteroidales bacterium]|nr:hypothetical protein [Bacteroidales bacterium]